MAGQSKFWRYVCDYYQYLGMLLLFLVFMLVLTVVTLLFGEPGTVSYTLATLNLLIIGIFGSVGGYLFLRCRERRRTF